MHQYRKVQISRPLLAMDSSDNFFRIFKFLPLTLRGNLVFNGRGLCLNPLVLLMTAWPCEITLPLWSRFFIFSKETIIANSYRRWSCEQAEWQDPPYVHFSHLKGQGHTIICIKKMYTRCVHKSLKVPLSHINGICAFSLKASLLVRRGKKDG